MTWRKRSRLSAAQKTEIWKQWKSGQTLHAIGRVFGRPHPAIRKLLLPRGCIAPAPRRRSRLALTLAEREDISRGIAVCQASCWAELRPDASHREICWLRCLSIGVLVAFGVLGMAANFVQQRSRRFGNSNFAAKNFMAVHIVAIHGFVSALIGLHHGAVQAHANEHALGIVDRKESPHSV
jgi:hypothetical protein